MNALQPANRANQADQADQVVYEFGSDVTAGALSVALSEQERIRLAMLEVKIRKGVQAWFEAGEALIEIRDGRLYRGRFATFEGYCDEVWGWSSRKARYVMDGTAIRTQIQEHNEAVAPERQLPLPSSESQTRALHGLPKEKQVDVWSEAAKEAGGKAPTAEAVKQKVENRKWPRPNASGIFEPSQCRVTLFKEGKFTARLLTVQVGPDSWQSSSEHQFNTSGSGSYPRAKTIPCDTEEEALSCAAAELLSTARRIASGENSCTSQEEIRAAKKLIDWCCRFTAARAKEWPKPNEQGFFEESQCEVISFTHPAAWAKILVVETAPGEWRCGYHIGFSVGPWAGGGAWPRADGPWYTNKEQPVAWDAEILRDLVKRNVLDRKGSPVASLAARTVAQKIVDWTYQFTGQETIIKAVAHRKLPEGGIEELERAVKGASAPAPEQLFTTGAASPNSQLRKKIVEAAERAVISIRALQDLVAFDKAHVRKCTEAVDKIDRLHDVVKDNANYSKPPLTWMICDAAADLGGLEEGLRDTDEACYLAVGRALAALKPLFGKYTSANGKVDYWAKRLEGKQPLPVPSKTESDAGQFVVLREPMPEAVVAIAQKDRYSTGGGWTDDPRKAEVFYNGKAAIEKAKGVDLVLTLAAALKRFQEKQSTRIKAADIERETDESRERVSRSSPRKRKILSDRARIALRRWQLARARAKATTKQKAK